MSPRSFILLIAPVLISLSLNATANASDHAGLYQVAHKKNPPAADGGERCRDTVGLKQANIYVNECLDASPATHPPCNVNNTCTLIWTSIKQSCETDRHPPSYSGVPVPPTPLSKMPKVCLRYFQTPPGKSPF